MFFIFSNNIFSSNIKCNKKTLLTMVPEQGVSFSYNNTSYFVIRGALQCDWTIECDCVRLQRHTKMAATARTVVHRLDGIAARHSAAARKALTSLGLPSAMESERWRYSGKPMPAINPSTGEAIIEGGIPNASKIDYERHLNGMDAAHRQWASAPAPARGEFVRCLGVELRRHKRDLATLISLETGKIISEAEGEVQESIDVCDYAVGLSRQIAGKIIPSERPDHIIYERWNPLKGHVGVISANNFPQAVGFWNLAISLVCGNTNMWKGAVTTQLTTIAAGELMNRVCRELGYPTDIATAILGGAEIGQLMSSDKRIELLSFTGSTKVGKQVAAAVAGSERLRKAPILELGGNGAMLIMADADMKLAIPAAVFGAVGTTGQRCTSTRRLLVQQQVYESVKQKLVAAYGQVKVGDPLEDGTHCGPLLTPAGVDIYRKTIEAAKQQGGKVLFGGEVMDVKGNFVQPTLIEIDARAPLMQQESFAPILFLSSFSDLEEGIELNNSVPQGLSSALFTNSIQNMLHWTGPNGSDCGLVNVNAGTSGAEIGGAFGGEKDTGGGRETGSDAWKAYTKRTTTCVNYSNSMPLAQGVKFDL